MKDGRKEDKEQLTLLNSDDDFNLSKAKKRVSLKRVVALPNPPEDSGLLFDNLINVETTAEVLGVAPKTVRKWVAIRSIPFVRIGHRT